MYEKATAMGVFGEHIYGTLLVYRKDFLSLRKQELTGTIPLAERLDYALPCQAMAPHACRTLPNSRARPKAAPNSILNPHKNNKQPRQTSINHKCTFDDPFSSPGKLA